MIDLITGLAVGGIIAYLITNYKYSGILEGEYAKHNAAMAKLQAHIQARDIVLEECYNLIEQQDKALDDMAEHTGVTLQRYDPTKH